MKKLNKSDADEKDRISAVLEERSTVLAKAVDEFNAAVEQARAAVEKAAVHYNAALQDAKAFAEEIAQEQQSFWDDKSERWQESDAGQAYQEWISEWESVFLDEAEIDWPDELSLPDLSAPESFANLPDEPA